MRARHAPGAAPDEERTAARGPRPVEALARSASLMGSVALAELLAHQSPAQAALPFGVPNRDARWLTRWVSEQLESLTRWVEAQLAVPREGRLAAPALGALARPGEGAEPASDVAQSPEDVAEAVSERWAQRVASLRKAVRREARRVRGDIAAELRALGPGAAAIERLDATLRQATQSGLAEADAEVAARFGAAVGGFLRVAHDPELFDRATVSEGEALEASAAELVRAALSEERDLIEALVSGCAVAPGHDLRAAEDAGANSTEHDAPSLGAKRPRAGEWTTR